MATVYLNGDAVKQNGNTVNIKAVAFDGCHKIYLLPTDEKIEEAKAYGYGIYRIAELPRLWFGACPLRFISLWDDEKTTIIEQCAFQGDLITDGSFASDEDADARILEILIR